MAEPHPSIRTALALGLAGRLGDALLARLVSAEVGYAAVYLGVSHPLHAPTAKFRPWVVGAGVVVADDAYLLLTRAAAPGAATAAPPHPARLFGESEAVPAAAIAHDCGVRRMVLIVPAPPPVPAADIENALRALRFERLLIAYSGTAPPAATAAAIVAAALNMAPGTAVMTVPDAEPRNH